MAKRPRRNATFPPHDPRAIKAALRAELYQVGDSLRQLDDIEFVTSPEFPQAISPVVNGIDLAHRIDHVPLWAFNRTWYLEGLSDDDGRRRNVAFTAAKKPDFSCCCASLDVSVAGRYVRWVIPPHYGGETFIFDRATYRERLEWCLAQHRESEPDYVRTRREFYQRTPWQGPKEMGLTLPTIGTTGTGLPALMFRDLMWGTWVTVIIGAKGESPDAALARATHLIARWDFAELTATWHGTVKPPSYPEHWVQPELGLQFQFRLDPIVTG